MADVIEVYKEESEDHEDNERVKEGDDNETDETDGSLQEAAKEFNQNTNIVRMEEVKMSNGETVKIFVVKQKRPGRRLKGEIYAKAEEVDNIKELIRTGRYDFKTGTFKGGARIRTILQRMDKRQSQGKIRIREDETVEIEDAAEKEAEEEIEKELAELRKKRMKEVKEKLKKRKESDPEGIIQEDIEVGEAGRKKRRSERK